MGSAEAGSWPSADATAGKISSHPNMYEVPPDCEACGEPVGMWEEILIGEELSEPTSWLRVAEDAPPSGPVWHLDCAPAGKEHGGG